MADIKRLVREEGGVQIVKMPVEFTGSAAYDLEEGLLDLARQKAPSLLLDMSDVAQITSAAISLLIKVTKTAEEHGGMAGLAELTPVVEDVFAITKMKEMLHVYASRTDAVKSLRSRSAPVGKRSAVKAPKSVPSAGETRAQVLLFDTPGPEHTERTLAIARQRAEELGLRHAVVATTTGDTAVKAARAFDGAGVQITAVTLMAGVWEKYDAPQPERVAEAERAGVRFLTATHTLMGNVGTAIREKFGGVPEVELIAHTYYTFSQGMKVAVEIAAMAADANLLPVNEDVIAVAGTGGGADTAIVIRPAYSNKFFDTKVREVLAMPR